MCGGGVQDGVEPVAIGAGLIGAWLVSGVAVGILDLRRRAKRKASTPRSARPPAAAPAPIPALAPTVRSPDGVVSFPPPDVVGSIVLEDLLPLGRLKLLRDGLVPDDDMTELRGAVVVVVLIVVAVVGGLNVGVVVGALFGEVIVKVATTVTVDLALTATVPTTVDMKVETTVLVERIVL
jgi:hypothetical protein